MGAPKKSVSEVWILMAIDYDSSEIVGAYSTEEQAEEQKLCLDMASSAQGYAPFDYVIKLCEVK